VTIIWVPGFLGVDPSVYTMVHMIKGVLSFPVPQLF